MIEGIYRRIQADAFSAGRCATHTIGRWFAGYLACYEAALVSVGIMIVFIVKRNASTKCIYRGRDEVVVGGVSAK